MRAVTWVTGLLEAMQDQRNLNKQALLTCQKNAELSGYISVSVRIACLSRSSREFTGVTGGGYSAESLRASQSPIGIVKGSIRRRFRTYVMHEKTKRDEGFVLALLQIISLRLNALLS